MARIKSQRRLKKNQANMKVIALLLTVLSVAIAQEIVAVVKIQPHNATSMVMGTVQFVQSKPDGPVSVTGTITGLKPGKHGFHIHEKGDLSQNCTSTGGHFNPKNQTHGAPADSVRHVGDLGNIEADQNGQAQINIVDKVIALSGPHSIIGRGVVIHSGEDDLGKKQDQGSKTTGNAGDRMGCGIVGILKPVGSINAGITSISSPLSIILTTMLALVLGRQA